MSKKRKAVRVGGSPVTPITAKERRRIEQAIKKKYARFRRKYPEVHGKVVDFITNSIDGDSVDADQHSVLIAITIPGSI